MGDETSKASPAPRLSRKARLVWRLQPDPGRRIFSECKKPDQEGEEGEEQRPDEKQLQGSTPKRRRLPCLIMRRQEAGRPEIERVQREEKDAPDNHRRDRQRQSDEIVLGLRCGEPGRRPEPGGGHRGPEHEASDGKRDQKEDRRQTPENLATVLARRGAPRLR